MILFVHILFFFLRTTDTGAKVNTIAYDKKQVVGSRHCHGGSDTPAPNIRVPKGAKGMIVVRVCATPFCGDFGI